MYTAWNIPDGYAICAMTGKFDRFENLSVTFPHHLFDRDFLKANGIYVEDADWLSAEGYDEIIDVLDRLGMLGAFYEALENEREIMRGEYPEIGSGSRYGARSTANARRLSASNKTEICSQ